MMSKAEYQHRRALIVQCVERREQERLEGEAERLAEQREQAYRNRLDNEDS
jgi:hypothetical protein